jgi:hypothetical protein
MVSREVAHFIFIIFSLTQQGLEPMIYHTQGKHANHYTTDMVTSNLMVTGIICYTLLYLKYKTDINGQILDEDSSGHQNC